MARKFNGSNQWYFRTPVHAGPIAAVPLTMLAWINPASLAADGNIFALGNNVGNTDLHRLTISVTTGEISASSRQGAATEVFATTSGAVPGTNAWSAVAGVFASATDRRVFWGKGGIAPVKGTNVTSATPAAPLQNIVVGSRQAGTVLFNGHMDFIVAWRYALSDTEIAQLMSGRHPMTMHPDQVLFCFKLVTGHNGAPYMEDIGPRRLKPLLPTNVTATAPTVPNAAGPTGQTVSDPPVEIWLPRGAGVFDRDRQRILAAASAGSTPISLDDVVSGSDTLSLAAIVALTETGSGADAISPAATVSTADTGTGTDVITPAAAATISETGSGSDATSATASEALAETGVGADTLGPSAGVTGADSGSGTDGMALVAQPSTSDSGASTDAIASAAAISISESGSGADATSAVASPAITETGSGVDTSSIAASISLAETGAGSDGFSIVIQGIPTFSDSGSGVDAFSVVVQLTISDSGGGTDAFIPSVRVTSADSAAGADTISALGLPTFAEAGSGLDTSTLAGAAITVVENGVGADSTLPGVRLSFGDVAEGQDIFIQLHGFFLTGTEPRFLTGATIAKSEMSEAGDNAPSAAKLTGAELDESSDSAITRARVE